MHSPYLHLLLPTCVWYACGVYMHVRKYIDNIPLCNRRIHLGSSRPLWCQSPYNNCCDNQADLILQDSIKQSRGQFDCDTKRSAHHKPDNPCEQPMLLYV